MHLKAASLRENILFERKFVIISLNIVNLCYFFFFFLTLIITIKKVGYK